MLSPMPPCRPLQVGASCVLGWSLPPLGEQRPTGTFMEKNLRRSDISNFVPRNLSNAGNRVVDPRVLL